MARYAPACAEVNARKRCDRALRANAAQLGCGEHRLLPQERGFEQLAHADQIPTLIK